MPAPSPGQPGSPKVYHIRPSNDGLPLSTALRKILGESTSWGEIKRLVASRHVTINGNLCVDEARKVKAGDVLHLHEHSRAPLPKAEDLVIRHVDEHVVVIEKPPGVNTLRHREEADLPQKRKDKAPTVEELLAVALRRYVIAAPQKRFTSPNSPHQAPAKGRSKEFVPHPLFGGKGGRPMKPEPSSQQERKSSPESRKTFQGFPGKVPEIRPVHRLDRDTSGLMLFALSPQAEQALERDFARHAVERKYQAVVMGQLTQPRTIETWLLRDRGDGLRGSAPQGKPAESQGAQRALTHVKPLESLASGAFTLVECQLETGRTHQIRIHLSEIGHPLAGEKTYTVPHPALDSVAVVPPTVAMPARHFLHSASLAFTHPVSGERLSFISPLSPDLASWLKRIR